MGNNVGKKPECRASGNHTPNSHRTYAHGRCRCHRERTGSSADGEVRNLPTVLPSPTSSSLNGAPRAVHHVFPPRFPCQITSPDGVGGPDVIVVHTTLDRIHLQEPTQRRHIQPGTHLDHQRRLQRLRQLLRALVPSRRPIHRTRLIRRTRTQRERARLQRLTERVIQLHTRRRRPIPRRQRVPLQRRIRPRRRTRRGDINRHPARQRQHHHRRGIPHHYRPRSIPRTGVHVPRRHVRRITGRIHRPRHHTTRPIPHHRHHRTRERPRPHMTVLRVIREHQVRQPCGVPPYVVRDLVGTESIVDVRRP